MMSKNKKQGLILLLGLALTPLGAYAEQVLNADERTPQKAQISRHSLSRVSIDGGRIANVKWIDEELEIEKDAEAGQIYVRALTGKPASLFVTSDEGKTYLLVLAPTAKQSDSIVINYRSQQESLTRQASGTSRVQALSTNSGSYVRAIKQLMVGMINGHAGSLGTQMSNQYETIPLWNEVLFVKKSQYLAADMVGESYTLTNVSSSVLTIREQEFFKKGVLAVTVIKQSLQPGESTDVYVAKQL